MGAPVDSLFFPTHRDEQATTWGPRHRRMSNIGAGSPIILGGLDGSTVWPDVGPGKIEWISNIHWVADPVIPDEFEAAFLDVVDKANNTLAAIYTISMTGGGSGIPWTHAAQPDIALMGGEHLIRLRVYFDTGAPAGNSVWLSWSSIVTIRGNASTF